jgi:hypothetical protein
MKNFCILLLFSGCSIFNVNKGFSQTDTLYLYQTYSSFSNQEKAEWTAFENNWHYVEYSELKSKHNVKKLNCRNCESFFADMYLEINESGDLASVKLKKGKLCGQPIISDAIMKEFEVTFKAHTFKYLKNRKFIAKFGHVLKC